MKDRRLFEIKTDISIRRAIFSLDGYHLSLLISFNLTYFYMSCKIKLLIELKRRTAKSQIASLEAS